MEGVDGRAGVNIKLPLYVVILNHIIRFNKMFGKHSINALAAYEFNDYWAKVNRYVWNRFIPGFEVLDVVAKTGESWW